MNDDELNAYLKIHPMFSQLAPKHLELLAQHVEEKAFAKQDALFKQGDNADSFFVLLAGEVSVGVPAVAGLPLVVQTLGINEVLGWSWLIPPYKWAFEAEVTQDSRVLVFDGKALRQAAERDNAFGYALMKQFAGLMSERLRAARSKMMESWAPAGWA